MRANLSRDLAEKDSRARENRRFKQGRVVNVDSVNHTVDVNVNEDEYLYDVPYTAQTPPNRGDVGDLDYGDTSAHSVRFINPRIHAGSSEGDIVAVGGAPKDAKYIVLELNP